MSAYTALAAVEKELEKAKEKLKKYSNIRTAISSLPGVTSICKEDLNATAAYTSNIIISYESIDAGSMSVIDDKLNKIDMDIEEMIAQGNRLVAKYEEIVSNLELERERLLAEIAAMEAAAASRQTNQNYYQSSSSKADVIIKPSFAKKMINQVK